MFDSISTVAGDGAGPEDFAVELTVPLLRHAGDIPRASDPST